MPKTPLSVTLDDANLLWLKGRTTSRKKRSLSETLDEILTEARTGGVGADAARSVVGTIDIADDDPDLVSADAAIGALFDTSLGRPFLVREAPAAYSVSSAAPARAKKASGAPKRRG